MTSDARLLLVASPLLVPLGTALVTAFLSRRARVQRAVSLAGVLTLLACTAALLVEVHRGGTIRLAFGNWPEPYAIAFAADSLGAAMALIAAVMGTACLLFQWSDADPAPGAPMLLPLVHALLAGVGGAFLTADLFNLYVWFEVILIAALGLLAYRAGERELDATLKYFVLNAVAAFLLLIGVVYVYAITGHLSLDAIGRAAGGVDAHRVLPFVTLLAVALLIKAAGFPLFAWLPAAYHTLPAPLLALFAALTTKVAVYALLRLLRQVFPGSSPVLYTSLGWIAVATMLTGVLGAAYHWDMRRILAFHIVSQIGYMLLGIALATPAGDSATIFYVIHHIVVKANLFLLAAVIARLTGSYDLRRAGGLYATRPWLGVLFLVPALSLVGVPPLSGFWAKFMVLRESFRLGQVWWAAAALLVGLLTLYSMLKIWLEAFWKRHPEPGWRPAGDTRLFPALSVCSALAGLTLLMGLWPEPFIRYALMAARSLQGAGAP